MPKLSPQIITYALAPKEKGEEDKVYAVMQKLLDEDVTLRLGHDKKTGDILLSGIEQLHIELAVEKAKRRFKVDIVLKTPRFPTARRCAASVRCRDATKSSPADAGSLGTAG